VKILGTSQWGEPITINKPVVKTLNFDYRFKGKCEMLFFILDLLTSGAFWIFYLILGPIVSPFLIKVKAPKAFDYILHGKKWDTLVAYEKLSENEEQIERQKKRSNVLPVNRGQSKTLAVSWKPFALRMIS